MNDIEIGSHIVCVNAKAHPEIKSLFKFWPVEGDSYVVRDVLLGIHHPNVEGAVRLLLVVMVNESPNGKPSCERGYDSRRFRKLEEVKASAKSEKENFVSVGA